MNNKIMLMAPICLAMVLGLVSAGCAAQKTILADTHTQNEISCENCHSESKIGKGLNDACIDCHGAYEDMAELTVKHAKTTDLTQSGHLYLENINPHEQHLGDIPCFSCHAVHTQPLQEKSPCYSCHTFNLDMP